MKYILPFIMILIGCATSPTVSNRLPVYRISLPKESKEAISKQVIKAKKSGFSSKKHKSYVNGTLTEGERNLKATFKLHGSTGGNYANKKISYSTKLLNNEKLDGANSVSFIATPQHEYLVPILANIVAKHLGLYFNKQELVELAVNEQNQGFYWKEEKVNLDFLIQRNLVNSSVVKLTDNWIEHQPYRRKFALTEIANVELIGDADSKMVLADYRKMMLAVESEDPEDLALFFDSQYMANFEAFRTLFVAAHDFMCQNLKMIYKADERKFYPVMRSEGELRKIQLWQGSPMFNYNQYSTANASNDGYLKLFSLLNGLPSIRNMKYEILHQLSKELDSLFSLRAKEIEHYTYCLINDDNDPKNKWEKRKIIKAQLPTLLNNMVHLERWIQFSACYINAVESKNNILIECIPDTEIPIILDSLWVELDTQISTPIHINIFKGEVLSNQYVTTCKNRSIHLEPITIQPFAKEDKLVKTTFSAQLSPTQGASIKQLHFVARNRVSQQNVNINNLRVATASN